MSNPAYKRKEWFSSSDLYCYRYRGDRITPSELLRMQEMFITELTKLGQFAEHEIPELVEQHYIGHKNYNRTRTALKLHGTADIVEYLGIERVESSVPFRGCDTYLPDKKLIATIEQRRLAGEDVADENWTPYFVLKQHYQSYTYLPGCTHAASMGRAREIFNKMPEMIDPVTGNKCHHMNDEMIRQLLEIGCFEQLKPELLMLRGVLPDKGERMAAAMR